MISPAKTVFDAEWEPQFPVGARRSLECGFMAPPATGNFTVPAQTPSCWAGLGQLGLVTPRIWGPLVAAVCWSSRIMADGFSPTAGCVSFRTVSWSSEEASRSDPDGFFRIPWPKCSPKCKSVFSEKYQGQQPYRHCLKVSGTPLSNNSTGFLCLTLGHLLVHGVVQEHSQP